MHISTANFKISIRTSLLFPLGAMLLISIIAFAHDYFQYKKYSLMVDFDQNSRYFRTPEPEDGLNQTKESITDTQSMMTVHAGLVLIAFYSLCVVYIKTDKSGEPLSEKGQKGVSPA